MPQKKLVRIQDICAHLETVAPRSLQEDYDNAQLIIGSPTKKVGQALLCLDCTEEVLDEAKKLKCGLVIAHHPIIFKGLKKITGTHYVERIVIKAIKNDIAIYASHTNMDNTWQGVNYKIAQKIGLKKLTVLAPKKKQLLKLYTYVPKKYLAKVKKALFQAGAGQIGNYQECAFEQEGTGSFKPTKNAKPHTGLLNKLNEAVETKLEVLLPLQIKNEVLNALKKAHPYEEVAYEIISLENKQSEIGSGIIGEFEKPLTHKALLQLLSKKMKAKGIRFTNSSKKSFKKIAICGGSGSFLIKNALAAQADAYITGDIKYHEFFEADNRLSLIDIGHYESEQYTPQLFYDILSKKMPTFALHISKVNTNPINYF